MATGGDSLLLALLPMVEAESLLKVVWDARLVGSMSKLLVFEISDGGCIDSDGGCINSVGGCIDSDGGCIDSVGFLLVGLPVLVMPGFSVVFELDLADDLELVLALVNLGRPRLLVLASLPKLETPWVDKVKDSALSDSWESINWPWFLRCWSNSEVFCLLDAWKTDKGWDGRLKP